MKVCLLPLSMKFLYFVVIDFSTFWGMIESTSSGMLLSISFEQALVDLHQFLMNSLILVFHSFKVIGSVWDHADLLYRWFSLFRFPFSPRRLFFQPSMLTPSILSFQIDHFLIVSLPLPILCCRLEFTLTEFTATPLFQMRSGHVPFMPILSTMLMAFADWLPFSDTCLHLFIFYGHSHMQYGAS